MPILSGPAPKLDWIQVELSASCTGGCLYCPVSRYRGKRREGFMTEETFQRLERAFSLTDFVYLQGWGEPLLHPGFWALVERVRREGPRVGFTTNGMGLDGETRGELLKGEVEILGVSLAGATPATHDRFREGNPLAVVDGHLRALRREKEKRGSELPGVHVAYQLLASNLSELPGVVDLAAEWGARQVVASNLDLILTPELQRESLASLRELRGEMEERLEEARARADAAGITFRAYRPDPRAPRPDCTENVLRSCFVAADGTVSPCVMTNVGLDDRLEFRQWFQGEAVPMTPLVLGNVNDEGLEAIWRSDTARRFRKVFRDRIWKGRRDGKGLPDPCLRCNKLYEE